MMTSHPPGNDVATTNWFHAKIASRAHACEKTGKLNTGGSFLFRRLVSKSFLAKDRFSTTLCLVVSSKGEIRRFSLYFERFSDRADRHCPTCVQFLRRMNHVHCFQLLVKIGTKKEEFWLIGFPRAGFELL